MRRLDLRELRLRGVEQQRVRARRAPGAGAEASLLLLLAVPLRLARAARALAEVPAAGAARAGLRCAAIAGSTAGARTVDRYWPRRDRARAHPPLLGARRAGAVHPPVEVERFEIGEPGDHVLFVAELVRHKRPEVAIEAAVAAGRPIKVVGDGPELQRLRERYGSSAEFLGRVDDEQLARLYAEAAALVVPNVEEFGIAAVEAQAAGGRWWRSTPAACARPLSRTRPACSSRPTTPGPWRAPCART